MVTVLPASPAAGVYVKAKGDTPEDAGLTEPAPSSVMSTPVALPPKVFPLTVTGTVLQVLPSVLLKVTTGGLAQPHDTSKLLPVVLHPELFLTVMVWLPLETPVNMVPG
jgi:hypothetical protein